MPERRCENCAAFQLVDQRGVMLDITSKPDGMCMLNPPQIIAANGPQGLALMTQQPMVKRAHWCMQFKPILRNCISESNEDIKKEMEDDE